MGSDVHKVKKLTLLYDPREDRLRLSATDTDGQVIGAWMTQRMSNLLVRSLIGCLDDMVESQPDVITGSKPATKPATQLLRQTQADLEKSRADRRNAPPVRVREPLAPATADAVIERVRMRRVESTYILDLSWRDGGISLPGDQTWLRQFLRVLYKNYRAGDWPVEQIWPNWFGDGAHRAVLGAHQIN